MHLHPQVCRHVLRWTSAPPQTLHWLCQCVLDISPGSCQFGSRLSCHPPTGWPGRSVQQPTWPPSLHVRLRRCTISRSTRATKWGATKAVRLIQLIRRHRKVRPYLCIPNCTVGLVMQLIHLIAVRPNTAQWKSTTDTWAMTTFIACMQECVVITLLHNICACVCMIMYTYIYMHTCAYYVVHVKMYTWFYITYCAYIRYVLCIMHTCAVLKGRMATL